jgi:hypothetical protein
MSIMQVERNRKWAGLLGLLLVAALPARADRAVTIEGIDFGPRVMVEEQPLELTGVGLLRYKVVFRAYVGALYLEPGATWADVANGDTAVRLELEYFWPIEGEAFGEASMPFLEDNMPAEAYARIAERVREINGLYRDVEPGDRYALTFIPGVGTELAYNGQRLGLIPGDDFGPLYLRIWLGDEPLDKKFKRQLLTPL